MEPAVIFDHQVPKEEVVFPDLDLLRALAEGPPPPPKPREEEPC